MFERYTEPARRVLFFARYEASQLGCRSIRTEHVLLGLARVRRGVVARILSDKDLDIISIGNAVRSRSSFEEHIVTSVEIPFDEDVKRVVLAAASEADLLTHDYIGVEHLLLGLLHRPGSIGGAILNEHGLRLDETRTRIVTLLNEQDASSSTSPEMTEILAMVDELELTASDLSSMPGPVSVDGLISLIRALRRRLEGLRKQ